VEIEKKIEALKIQFRWEHKESMDSQTNGNSPNLSGLGM
jgi:hypothetical protein